MKTPIADFSNGLLLAGMLTSTLQTEFNNCYVTDGSKEQINQEKFCRHQRVGRSQPRGGGAGLAHPTSVDWAFL
jgi:hypothetical protein